MKRDFNAGQLALGLALIAAGAYGLWRILNKGKKDE